ncbi:MAG: penicillin-binding transpeptidase domain-containing protein [Acidimicrobiales bacterium]
MNDSTQVRLRLIGVVIVSLMAALVARLWFLQSVENEELRSIAEGNHLKEVLTPASRGLILDAQGRPLVTNKRVTVVSIDLAELDHALPGKQNETKRLAMLTHLATELSGSGRLTKVADLQTAMAASGLTNIGKVTVATDVSPELFVFFGERQDDFPGVQIESKSVRVYPYGSVAAHVLGYMGRIDQKELKSRNADWNLDDPTAKVYLNDDDIGKTGIEYMFEGELHGTPGRDVYEVDRNQRVIRRRDELSRSPIAGNNIKLTIDIDVQQKVEQELARGLQTARETPPEPKKNPTDPDPPEAKASAGSAVLMDPMTGDILAMASYPTYDPNDFVGGISQAKLDALNDKAAFQPILNRAIQGQYAPGSTFKLVTAFAAMTPGPREYPMLSAQGIGGYLDPKDDPGYYEIPDNLCEKQRDKTKKETGDEFTSCRFINPDLARHQGLDVSRALAVSSDAYFYEIAANYDLRNDFDSETIQAAAEKFGFGHDTGSGLRGEAPGIVPTKNWLKKAYAAAPRVYGRDYWVTADTVQMAVGQGNNLATPLQLTNAYATFANGGTVLAPNVAKELTAADGKVLRTWGPRQVGSVDISPEIRGPLLNGLLGAVNLPGPEGDRGTAYDAFHSIAKGGIDFALNEFPIAGKTGTAEVQGKADSAWFVGFGPVKPEEPPRYVFSVLLEESGFGGRFAAPVAAFVLNDLLFKDVAPVLSADQLRQCQDLRNPAAFTRAPSKYDQSVKKATTTTTLAPSSSTTKVLTTTRPGPAATNQPVLMVPAAAANLPPIRCPPP